MSIYWNVRRWFAAHRDAVANAESIREIEDFLDGEGLCPIGDETAAERIIEEMIEDKQMFLIGAKNTQHMADLIVAHRSVGLTLQAAAIALSHSSETFRAGLLKIVKEASAVNKPNGTTRMLLRIAQESLISGEASPTNEGSNDLGHEPVNISA